MWTRAISASAAAALLFLIVGCTDKHSRASDQRNVHPLMVRTSSNEPWTKVIRDMYDGRIEHQHSCAAVRSAIAHLPEGPITGPPPILLAYERKVC
jgi:hypothetical protein